MHQIAEQREPNQVLQLSLFANSTSGLTRKGWWPLYLFRVLKSNDKLCVESFQYAYMHVNQYRIEEQNKTNKMA